MGKDKKKKWHKYFVGCPKCEKPVEGKSAAAFTSSGDIRISGFCRSCKIGVFWETDILVIMESCAREDKGGEGLKAGKLQKIRGA